MEAKGNVIIQDVVQKHQYIPKPDDSSQQDFQQRRAQIASEIRSLNSLCSRLRLELVWIKESQLLFDSYANKFAAAFSQNSKEGLSMNCIKLSEAFRLFKEARITKLKANCEKQRFLENSIEDIESNIAGLNRKLEESGFIGGKSTTERKDLTITVYTDVGTSFEFDLSYGKS